MRLQSRCPGLSRVLFVIAFSLVTIMAAPSPAMAQAADSGSTTSVSVSDLEALVDTIQDEAKRKELVTQLRGLIEAAKGTEAQKPDESLGPQLITTLSAMASQTSRELVNAANRLSDIPVFVQWVENQVMDPAARNTWLEALAKLALIIAVGFVAEYLVRKLLTGLRRNVENREAAGIWLRIPLLAARTVLDMLPIAAFAGVAYGVLPFVDPAAKAQVLVVTFLQAYLMIRGLIIFFRMLLVPAVPTLRVLPLGGETANYLFIWVRRLIFVWVAGYHIAEASYFLGLPGGGRDGLLRVVGLLVAVMVIVFILQNRTAVSGWLGGAIGRSKGIAGRGTRTLRWLADIWHVLAIIYVIGVFAVWALQIEGGFEYLLRASVVSVVILFTAKVLSVLLRRGVERGFAVRDDVRARFPLLEARVNRYVPLVHLVLRAVLFIIVTLALMQAWGIDALGSLGSPLGQRITGSALSIAFILVLSLIIWEAVSTAIERYLTQTDGDGILVERSARARTLLPLLRNALLVLLVVMVSLIVLAELGINIGPLLAGAGVVGLAIGFGSQKLVQDVITGAFILFEDSIAVGDIVTAGGISGVVERLSIRSIRMRDLSGEVHTIPFSAVEIVTNKGKDFSMAVIDAGVAYRESVDEVMEVLRQLGAELQEDEEFGPLILEPLEMLGVDELADSAVVIKCRFKVRPIKQWAVKREFNRRMKNRFDELGIEIPFPHQTLYFGVDKDGTAPPAFVRTNPRKPRKKVQAEKLPEPEVPETPEAETPQPGPDLPSADGT